MNEGTVTRTSLKKYASRTTQQLAPIRISHHIRLFFNVTTRAARTRSNSHPTATRTFFMMNSLKNPRGSHYTASRTTAATRTLFFNVTTRAARTRSNSHPAVARTAFSDELAKKMTQRRRPMAQNNSHTFL